MLETGKQINKTAGPGISHSRYYEQLENTKVKCTLCPNYCILKENQTGLCKVKKNIDGQLYNLNHGLSTYFVVESIETNAVFHYMPQELTLSIGSVGCNLDCCFCQAWKYSKDVKITENQFFNFFTPQEIINKTKDLGLKAIAWTFNDPMSWFEFVLETAKLAKENGILNIFKSNHYVNPEPLHDLMQYVDIFSVSLKSIRNDFYQSLCCGSIEPVFNSIKMLKDNNKYLEICNLVIPGYNNSDKDFTEMVQWIKENVGTHVPLHFARFHPDYKLTHVHRTPIEDIHRAYRIARKNGFSYVYSGNIFVDDYLHTYCPQCQNILIKRKGERSWVINKNREICDNCGRKLDIVFRQKITPQNKHFQTSVKEYIWKEDIWSFHLQLNNQSQNYQKVILEHCLDADCKNNTSDIDIYNLKPFEQIRYAINRVDENHTHTRILHEKEIEVSLFDNLDRAYYYSGE